MEKDLRVLLVDDDEDEYILIRDMFSHLPDADGQSRFTLAWASSYSQALALCGDCLFDILLVDYHLGQNNGLDLIQAAKMRGCLAPSILLTGQGSYELDLAASEQGVFDYLLKDQVNPPLLERTIRYALERHEAEQELENRVRQRTHELAAANQRLEDANRELNNEITRRIRVEEILRESEVRFRALADTTSAAIFIVQDGKIRYANPATRFVTGYTAGELVGSELWRLVHPAYQAPMRESRMVSHWANDVPARYEIKILHKEGSERWVDMTAGRMEYDGRPAWVFTAFDITERDLAEQALRQARDQLELRVAARTAEIQAASQRLQTVMRTLPVGIIIADAEGRLVESNDAFTDLWETLAAAESRIEEWPDLPAWGSENGENVMLRDLLIQSSVNGGETILGRAVDIQTASGTRKSVLFSSVPISSGSGEIIGGVAVIQDISHQRHLEQTANTAALMAQQRADELEGLHRATAALLSTLDLDELLCQILDAAQSAIPASERGMLHLVSPVSGQLQVRATLGFRDERICVIHSPHEPVLPARVSRDRRPLLIPDAAVFETHDESAIPEEMRDARSIILAPLYFGEHVFGTLSLCAISANVFTESNLRLLASFAATTTAALQNAILHSEIKHLAVTDPLTGGYNRRAFFDLGERELERFLRFSHPLTAVMIDLDNFKLVNDTHGHVAGDQILRSLAERCRNTIRETDIFGRYGGDEFALLLPDTDIPAAQVIAQRIRDAVTRQPWQVDDSQVQVSISLGLAPAHKLHRSLEELLADADQALYKAKSNGRDRIEILEASK